MNPPVPGRKYTMAEIAQLRKEYPGHVMPGYYLRYDADGMASWVPWNKVTTQVPRRGFQMTWDDEDYPFHEQPVRRRTPQERLDSLAERIAEDLKAGRVLGPEEIERATANAWKRGNPVSGEAVRAVAAEALRRAEELAKPEHQGRTPEVR